MPRQAHGRPVSYTGPARPAKRKPAKGRGLNALEIAEQENPDTYKIRQHRLGESYEGDDDANTRQDVDERSSKRRKITTEQNGQESDSGSDPEGERWHVGVDEEDEDSDIDSDDAFGESDEDRFADFTFRGSEQHKGKKSQNKKKPGTDSEEEFDDPDAIGEIADDFGDDAIDLAAALDMESEEESETEQNPSAKRKRAQRESSGRDAAQEIDDDDSQEENDEDTGDDSGEDSDQSEDQSDLFASDNEDGDHSRLQTFVEGLSRRQDAPQNNQQETTKSTKISAADLVQYVKDPQQRQSLKVLQNSEARGPEVYKGGIPGRLAPPLAKRQQDKLDRAAAYDESKKELNKWVDTVKQNRRAEHISFPLADPSDAPSRNDKFMPVNSSRPMNSLESKIQDIMRESGLLTGTSSEKQELDYEELEEQKLSPEEVQARRAELRRARDLMFREELRAKRIKKIKSKAFRRVHRKERDKAAMEKRAELAAQGLLDSDDEKEKNDRLRAEERMGARHRESKWARGAKAAGRTVWDEDARVGVADMARRDDELRRRIEGKASGSSDESGADSDAYSSDEADESIRQQLSTVEPGDVPNGGSKLANMAFMKRAEAGKKAANDAQLQQIRRQMQPETGNAGQESDAEDDVDEQSGRQKFGSVVPGPEKRVSARHLPRAEFEERMSDDGEGEEEVLPLLATTHDTVHETVPHSAKDTSNVKITPATNDTRRVTKQQLKDSQRRQAPASSSKQSLPSTTKELNGQVSEPETDGKDDVFDINADEGETLADAIFGGPDDVGRDFQKEKRQLVEEEGDQIIDNSLAGWGSWGGAGISKKKQKQSKDRFVTKVKGIAPEARKDAKLDRVIINEKRVKKNGKYLATELPHPFESRSQYERAMRLPLGPEWTTKSTFQDATKPRVLVKQGIIKPMSKPMV